MGPVSEVGHDALGTNNGPNPRIGLTPNTMGNEANTPANKVQRFNQTVDLGVNFMMLADLSDQVRGDLSSFYGLGGDEAFEAFLQSLGMFDSMGNPKEAWHVFTENVPLR